MNQQISLLEIALLFLGLLVALSKHGGKKPSRKRPASRKTTGGRRGYIYLMSSRDERGKTIYKIGRTKRDPQKRREAFKTGNPFIKMVHWFPARNMFTAESSLHKRYKSKRIVDRDDGSWTEWFRLDSSDVKTIRRMKGD